MQQVSPQQFWATGAECCWTQDRVSACLCRWYYTSNSGLQAQSVLYTTDAPDDAEDGGGNPKIMLDPNTFSSDGTVALSDYTFSWDGRYLAYSIAS